MFIVVLLHKIELYNLRNPNILITNDNIVSEIFVFVVYF